MMKSVVQLACLVLFCVASASAFEAEDYDNVDPRTITVSGSNVYLSLNTTTLLLGGVALLALIAVVAVVFVLPAGGAQNFEKQSNGGGYENYYDPDLAAANSPHADAALAYAYSAHQQQDYRQKRSLGLAGHNLSTKMSQLEQAIKKYDGESEDSKDSKQ